MYSEIFNQGDKSFRYNYSTQNLEWIQEAEKVRQDNIEWERGFGYPLWDAETTRFDDEGNAVIRTKKVLKDKWEDAPQMYVYKWALSIDMEFGAVKGFY